MEIMSNKYSFESTYPQIIGRVERIKSVVSVSTSHELSNQDNIKLNVKPNLSVGIGTSTSIYTKRDLITGNILINPISFNSSGINTETDTILINSHNLKTGDKILYSSNSVASGLSTGFYYVYKINDNSIKFCETYIDSKTIPPITLSIGSTGGENQSISLINPQITSFKNNNLVFNLSDNSLVGYNFKIYYDKDYKNEFTSTQLSGIGSIGVSNNASITINYDSNIPTRLYYNLEKSGYISTSDKEVNNYSEILFADSEYNSNYKISGVGSTTFTISLSKKPEKLTYTLNECDKLQYTTNSLSTKGPIDKINIISGGSGYKKLPIFKGSNSLAGKDAYIISKSTSIGNAKEVRIIDEGFQYSSDKTLQPIAAVSPLIIIKNSNTIDSVIVTNGGRGYTDAPSIVIVNTETGEKINSGILEAILSGNTISSINIIQKPKGIPETAVGLYATNNTNGISIQKVESSSTGIFTCFIRTPTLGFSTPPFNIGDKVFVEGIQKSSISGDGFNSEDYGYKLFTISDYNNTTGVLDTVTIDISEFTTNTGVAKTVQDSIGNIIKSIDYPSFNITKIPSSFNIGEKLISNGIERDLKISSYQNSFIKVSGRYELSAGEVIIGKESGNITIIDKIESGFGRFNVDYSVEKSIGWSNDVGKLDQDNQVIPDNDYYQNLSYTIKSPITYQELRTPVNSLVHSSGLKNFSDTGITSTTNSGITTSENATTIFYDIIEENRVDTIYDFDLVKDIDVVGTSSKFLKLKNKKLTDYIECKTNVVLKIDNINRQFSDADGNPSEFINLVELNSGESYINLLVRISTADNSQIQLSEIIILDNGNDLFLAEKSTIVNTGTEIIHFLEETTIGEFLLISDDNNDNYLRFVPKDPFNIDYDIKLINTNFNSDFTWNRNAFCRIC
jgi:predicted RNA-binding protein with TRAM domain